MPVVPTIEGVPTIRLTTVVAADVARCFELSLSVDAHTASMSGSRERIVGGVASGSMRLGDTVTWRAVHFGIPFTMTSRITAYDEPRRFVDEQVSGPFHHWRHEHTFEAVGSGTLVADAIDYASPLGPLGRAVDAAFLARYLTRLIETRNRWLADELART
jgi:ligand-binding SRPBCC domain-containing protein